MLAIAKLIFYTKIVPISVEYSRYDNKIYKPEYTQNTIEDLSITVLYNLNQFTHAYSNRYEIASHLLDKLQL